MYWLNSITQISSSPLRCSVSCVTFWLSDTYRSSGNVTSIKRTWIDQTFKPYFKTRVNFVHGHYFYMESEEQKIKELFKSRFSSIIFLLRLAGIPFKMQKISTIYAIYMRTVIFCTCTTFLGMFFDVYVHRDDLGHVMTNIRMFIPMVNNLWIYAYGRYVRTHVETLLASKVFV